MVIYREGRKKGIATHSSTQTVERRGRIRYLRNPRNYVTITTNVDAAHQLIFILGRAIFSMACSVGIGSYFVLAACSTSSQHSSLQHVELTLGRIFCMNDVYIAIQVLCSGLYFTIIHLIWQYTSMSMCFNNISHGNTQL